MTETDIVRFLHSRFGTAAMMAIAVVAAVISYHEGGVIPIEGSNGIGLPSANEWLPPGVLSLVINLALNIGVALLMVLANRSFNITRSVSALFAGMFLILQMPFPSFLGQFYGGTLLSLIVILSANILFSSFNRTYPLQPVFLIFFMLAAGAFTQYAYVFYLPVFIVGCAQMRIFGFRTVLAAGIGMITPLWILAGFGIISPEDFTVPQFRSVLAALENTELLQMSVSLGFTMLLCMVFVILNVIRTFNYNAQTRSYNGFISLLSIATVLFILFDYRNLAIYVPMLNCCAAFQMGHFFATYNSRRSYIAILCIIMAYVALYLWTLWA